MSSPEESSKGPVIRDLRRIDPATGQVRTPDQGGPAQAVGPRGSGKPSRPGKHAASKPGRSAGKGDTQVAGGAPAAGTRGPSEASGPQSTSPPQPPGPAGAPGAAAPGEKAPTGQLGTATEAASGPRAASPADRGDVAARLAERTADLQRMTAEYANYRKRVERDRLVVREQALANVLSALLPVLDDVGRAREHGELTGGFKSVADSLDATTGKLGLVSFGTEGEPFDPRIHEALMHSYSADVTEPVCAKILQPGYKVGERILRPARVAVAEPAEPVSTDGSTGAGPSGDAGTGPAGTGGPAGAGPFGGAGPSGDAGAGPAGTGGPAGAAGPGMPGGASPNAGPGSPGHGAAPGGNAGGVTGPGADDRGANNTRDPAAADGTPRSTSSQPGTPTNGD